MAEQWQTWRYRRINVKTGVAHVAERGFISQGEFFATLNKWNKSAPTRWRYEPVYPIKPVGQARDTVSVKHVG